jgi:T5SS/PEP-CTERM-associated repeat protein
MINGPLRVGVGGTGNLMVQSGASVSSGGDGTVNSIIGVLSGGSGTVTVTGAGSTWTNTGNIFVGDQGSGTLIISGNGTISASGTIFVGATGIIKGDGNISAAISNSGAVAPGNSPGALHISGTYTQTSGGKLQAELAGTAPGTGYDQLLVTGAASLAGTLDVSLVGGFKPVTGSAFDVLIGGSRTGTFATAQLPDLGGRIEWNTTYTATTATISVLATYYAGDLNRDSHIDIADVAAMESALVDLTTYQATHGPGGGALTDPQLLLIANLDGSAPVTNADLQGLLNLLANGAGAGSVSAVPEPPAIFLAVIALACIMAQPAACVWPRQQNLSNLHQG